MLPFIIGIVNPTITYDFRSLDLFTKLPGYKNNHILWWMTMRPHLPPPSAWNGPLACLPPRLVASTPPLAMPPLRGDPPPSSRFHSPKKTQHTKSSGKFLPLMQAGQITKSYWGEELPHLPRLILPLGTVGYDLEGFGGGEGGQITSTSELFSGVLVPSFSFKISCVGKDHGHSSWASLTAIYVEAENGVAFCLS